MSDIYQTKEQEDKSVGSIKERNRYTEFLARSPDPRC